jgi:DNA mismatch repair protein MutL
VSPIRVLERSVAERIAAGEVVDRPASAVKELVENSLDAGACSITVEAGGGGLRLIRVTDDGCGIPAAEVPLAFERFATSKVATVDDLGAVRSYGFRGEALPSIAAVALVTLTTRTPGAGEAARIVVRGGVTESLSAHGAPPGTTVEAATLFFNTPARLKFLKSPAREQALIADVVQRAAVAHPEVTFRLVLGGREAGYWPRAGAGARVADLLASGDTRALVRVDGEVPAGRLTGWLGRPELSRPSRAGQYVFVNRRPVHSSLLRKAVEQAYAQLLPVGRFPVFAVFLELDPASVDVNVHPRKLEVRFRDEGSLFGWVVRTARAALLASPLVRAVPAWSPRDAAGAGAAASGSVGSGEDVGAIGQAGALDHNGGRIADSGSLLLASDAREPRAEYAPTAARLLPVLRPLGQFLNAYILAEGPDGLYLIDQHAAHERVLYERLLSGLRRGGVASQVLAVPLTVDVTPGQMALVAGHIDRLGTLGYQVEAFGSRTLLLRAVPAAGGGGQPDALLLRAIGALAEEAEEDRLLERLAIATACHTAIRSGDRLAPEAVAALLADLARAEDPYTCFHGRPTVIAVPLRQIERWFLRE